MNAEPQTFKGHEAGVNRLGDVVVDGIYSTRECRYGRMKWLTRDYGVGQQIALYGEYCEGEVVLFRRLIRRGDVVLSAGGNIGAHLVPLSQIVGGDGMVITCEPQDFLRPVLEENLMVNGCVNVEVHPWALGSAPGRGAISTTDPSMPNNFGGMHVIAADESVAAQVCDVTTIDAMQLQRLDFLMLDIEGMEEEALRGAERTIALCRPLLYVEIDKEEKREPLLRYIKDELRYEVLFHMPYIFNPHNFARNPTNHFGEQRSIMCLAVPT